MTRQQGPAPADPNSYRREEHHRSQHHYDGRACQYPLCREQVGWRCAECGHYFARSQVQATAGGGYRCRNGAGHVEDASIAAASARLAASIGPLPKELMDKIRQIIQGGHQ